MVKTIHYLKSNRKGYDQTRSRGPKGGTISQVPNHYGGAKSLRGSQTTVGAPKSLNNVTSTSFNTVHLLPKDVRFEHGSAKLASCPVYHLTSLSPWLWPPPCESFTKCNFGWLHQKLRL